MIDDRQRRLLSDDLTGQNTSSNLENFTIYGNVKNAFAKKRSLILWELPHIGDGYFMEMYVNPQSIVFSSRKEIEKIRTKGGYVTQYWGEDLDTVSIEGVTGDAGIEGINVLRDIYRSEQLALLKIVKNREAEKRRQSLMQLATSVVMWYQGQGYRGYFNDMTYNEGAATPGLFSYSMNFTVIEIIGKRSNFMSWHRRPWSTTEHPNSDNDQTTIGGGYKGGEKVGILNTLLIDPIRTARTSSNGMTVTIFRQIKLQGQRSGEIVGPDPKDPGLGSEELARKLNEKNAKAHRIRIEAIEKAKIDAKVNAQQSNAIKGNSSE